MRSVLAATLLAAATMTFASQATAAETRVVPANRASAIFLYYTAMTSTCYPGARPIVHYTSGPSHGSVTSFWKAFKMGKEAGRCTGTPVHGTLIVYRPNPGYHGSDKVSIIFSEGMGNDYVVRPKEWTLDITVK